MSATQADQAEVDLAIQGMTCASCANRIERKLNKLDGVTASVNYVTETASVSYPADLSPERLLETVDAAGYSATLPQPAAEEVDGAEGWHDTALDGEAKTARDRLVISAALSIPVIAMAMFPALQFTYWQWISLVLASPVVAWGGFGFHRAALKNLRHGAATMDTLISMGTLAAYVWSLYALLWGEAGMPGMRHEFVLTIERTGGGGAIYLEVAAGVTTFILAGRFFEARAKRRAGAALRALLELGAKNASVLRDGVEQRVPIAQLAVDDVFVVRPGATPRRPDLRGVRADRDPAGGRHPRVLAGHRGGHGSRLHRRRRGPDHRLPLRARPRDTDRAARRYRPGCPVRHPDQGPRGPRIHPACRHDRAGQDRHRHHGPDGAGGRPRRRRRARLRRRRGAAAGGHRGGRVGTPDRQGHRAGGPGQGRRAR